MLLTWVFELLRFCSRPVNMVVIHISFCPFTISAISGVITAKSLEGGGICSIHDRGSDVFGLKIYTLSIFLGQEICNMMGSYFSVGHFDARYFFGCKISGSCIFLGSQCEASSDPLPQSCILQVTPWSLEDLVLRFEQTISERIHIKKRSQVSLCSYKPISESLISFLSIFLCVLLCSLF